MLGSCEGSPVGRDECGGGVRVHVEVGEDAIEHVVGEEAGEAASLGGQEVIDLVARWGGSALDFIPADRGGAVLVLVVVIVVVVLLLLLLSVRPFSFDRHPAVLVPQPPPHQRSVDGNQRAVNVLVSASLPRSQTPRVIASHLDVVVEISLEAAEEGAVEKPAAAVVFFVVGLLRRRSRRRSRRRRGRRSAAHDPALSVYSDIYRNALEPPACGIPSRTCACVLPFLVVAAFAICECIREAAAALFASTTSPRAFSIPTEGRKESEGNRTFGVVVESIGRV
mmetsp:Transcript_34700/g.70850  ORF Transcript_34700/g.70850 Transcript_34700/m.70850 type:complete len:281 (-) Transcript_34700:20-862(-)